MLSYNQHVKVYIQQLLDVIIIQTNEQVQNN